MFRTHASRNDERPSKRGVVRAGPPFARDEPQGGVGVVGRGGAWAVACGAVAGLPWLASRFAHVSAHALVSALARRGRCFVPARSSRRRSRPGPGTRTCARRSSVAMVARARDAVRGGCAGRGPREKAPAHPGLLVMHAVVAVVQGEEVEQRAGEVPRVVHRMLGVTAVVPERKLMPTIPRLAISCGTTTKQSVFRQSSARRPELHSPHDDGLER